MNPLFGAAALLTLTAAAGVAFWPHPRRARPSFGAASLGLAALYLALGALPLASIQFSVGAAVLLRLTVSPRSSKGTPPAAGRSEAAELSETPATPWWRLGAGGVALLALGLFAGGVYPLAPPMPRPFAPPLPHYLLVAAGLFCLGLYGTLTHRHAPLAILSVALMLSGAGLNLAAFAWYQDVPRGGRAFALLAVGLTASTEVWWGGAWPSGPRPGAAGWRR